MAIAVTFNNVTYNIPSPGESAQWATALNLFLVALGTALGPTTNNVITVASGRALKLQGDLTNPVSSAFCIVPQNNEPSGANIVGDIYVTSTGILKICTVAGTPGTFVSVGAQ